MEKSVRNWLTGLDALRFLLAVVILIYHFPHFDNIHFSNADVQVDNFFLEENDPVLMMNLPYKSTLSLIYRYGDFAVRVFWMISGIILFTFYHDAIRIKHISFYRFLLLRFSRLYPLHILTLCLAAVLQYVYFQKFGNYFIYKNNDAIHFLLNLLMINYWNARFGFSFNGPFWSVSIELFIYIVFFLFSSVNAFSSGKKLMWLITLFFFFFYAGILIPFSEGLLYFFAGCYLIHSSKHVNRKNILIATGLLMLFIIIKYINGSYDTWDINRIAGNYIQLYIAALLVIAFMLTGKRAGDRVQKLFRHVGNMTYAIYMIHICIQLIIILCFYENGRSFFMNNIFFLTYIAVCCFLGHLAYAFLEKPAQRFLRKHAMVNDQS